MKFIYHNIKMLLNKACNQGWVLGELFIVFIVLWYLCDSIGCLAYTVSRPQGADFSHIYEVQLTPGGEPEDTAHTYVEKVLMMRDRLRRMTNVVEAAGLHYASDPMGEANRWMDFFCVDTASVNMRYAYMDDGMMQVFRFCTEEGQPKFETMPAADSYVMLTREAVRRMKEVYPPFTTDSTIYSRAGNLPIRIYSILADFRPGRFNKPEPWTIVRLDDNMIAKDKPWETPILMIRVLPEVDRSDFSAYFQKEIAPLIEVDNVMVLNLLPYTKTMDSSEQVEGHRDRLQTHSFIALFLLVNVFMGIVDTFWFRTRRRRSEIALRLSMGSSRQQIRRLLLGEGLILLTIVAIPALVVCFNLALAEPTIGNSPLIAVWGVDWSMSRFLLGIGVTWVLMAVMIVCGIWAPAGQAIKIQPAEALHEE